MGSGLCLKIFLLCSALIVTDGTSTTVVTGTEGGNAHIRCEYSDRYGNYTKYFCKGGPPFCKDMVRTDATHKLVKQGRYSLYDNGRDAFEVNITHLSIEDEGLYQCAVDIPLDIDMYEEVYIDVTDGPATISPTLLPNVTYHHEASSVGTSGPTDYTANSTLSGPKGESNGHPAKLYLVLSASVGLIVVLMVGMLILTIILCVKRAKSSDSVNLPAAMETASVGP